ncbi:hypothetical protein AURDEDRAFT_169765 [Auricularia subglabra TFB-10046 SS5]|nr:hypothetical protein AURDEDRAFT_169765 [Auricularia subglabra TFB-10046 SS5]
MSSAHLHSLKRLLEGIDSELAATEDRHRTCRQAFETAQAALKAVEQQHSALEKSRDSLKRAIREARRTLQSASLLPDELLALVFEHAASYGITRSWHGLEWSSDNIDWDLVTLPHDLRLVCKRWNAIALSTRALWKYIAVSAAKEYIDELSYPAYLRLQLERSRPMLLSVVIQADIKSRSGERSLSDIATRQLEFVKVALDLLGPEVYRIRTLEVYGNTPSYRESPDLFRAWDRRKDFCHMVMGFLRLPTPNLEDLYAIIDQGDEDEGWFLLPPDSEPLPLYLPEAPKLRRVRLDHLPVLCRLPHPGLPSLSVLSLEFFLMYETHFLDTLTLCPGLKELSIRIECLTRESATPARLVSAPVHFLDIGFHQSGDACIAHLTFPAVTSLNTPAYYIRDIVPKVASTVTDLTIENGEVDDDHMPILATMTMLEEVSFEGDAIDDGMLADYLCRHDDPLWPRLRNIEVHSGFDIYHGANLVRAVEHRAGGSAGKARPLEKITLRGSETASWVATRLKAILGPENVTIL